MNRADLLNMGADLRVVFGGYVAITAGGGGDNTEYNGAWVSRKDTAGGQARSAKAIVLIDATITAAQTLKLLGNMQYATDSGGTGATDFGAALSQITVLSATGTTVVELDFNLIGVLGDFVRLQITPDLSNANTDTARIMIGWVFGGYQKNPVTKSVV